MKTDNTTKPTKPVIIYDGECNFCLSGIRRIQNKDQAAQFTYTYTPNKPPISTHTIHNLKPSNRKKGCDSLTQTERSIAERTPSTRFIDDLASIATSHGSTLCLSSGRCSKGHT